MDEKDEVILEDQFKNLFAEGTSGTGEEELLKTASRFARQLSITQIRALAFLKIWGKKAEKFQPGTELIIDKFIEDWLELKHYHGSALYVMRALEAISLRRFITENTLKINLEKK